MSLDRPGVAVVLEAASPRYKMQRVNNARETATMTLEKWI